jgi:hypothetical protein
MMDTIARSGSFAAAARELGKVPSALTYSVRQLEDALDVLLFDRRFGPGQTDRRRRGMLGEGPRLLAGNGRGGQARAPRFVRLETQLTGPPDGVISRATMLELCEASTRWTRPAPTSTAGNAAPARACACAPR